MLHILQYYIPSQCIVLPVVVLPVIITPILKIQIVVYFF